MGQLWVFLRAPVSSWAAQLAPWAVRVTLLVVGGVLLIRVYAGLRQRETCHKCAWSLILLLFGMEVLLLSEAFKAWRTDVRMTPQAEAGVGLVFALLLVAALVAGMLGLAGLQDRRKKARRGRGWALAGCVGSALGLFGVLAAGPANLLSLPSLLKPFTAGGDAGPPIAMEDVNFRFSPPGAPWGAEPAVIEDAGTKLVFKRSDPEMRLEVGAGKYGGGFDTDQLAEVGRAKIRKRFSTEEVLSVRPKELGGFTGAGVETRGQRENREWFTLQWYYFANGFGYYLVAEGPWAFRRQVRSEAERYFSGFGVIDADRTTDEGGRKFDKDFTSQFYGYTVALANSPWRQWPGLQRDFSWFEFAARQEAGVYLAVVPVWFGQELDEDAILSALLRSMNIQYPNEDLGNRERVDEPGRRGVQFTYQRLASGLPFEYRLRVQHARGYAWLTAVWAARQTPGLEAAAKEAFVRVRFNENLPEKPELENLSRVEKEARGLMVNEAGGVYFARKDYARARGLFADAYETSGSPLCLYNLLSALVELKESREGLALVEKELRAHSGALLLRSYKAVFQEQAGELDAAAETYAGMLAEGIETPDWFERYVALLLRLDRHAVALDAVQKELRKGDLRELRLLEAAIHRDKKDYAQATARLRELREKSPFALEVNQALATTLIEAGQYAEALTICQEAAQHIDNDGLLFALKGRCEAELGRFADSAKSLEVAQRLMPGNAEVARSLERVRAALGQGEKHGAQTVLEPVRLPDELVREASKPPPEGYGAEYGAYYTLRLTAVQLEENGVRRETDYGRVHLLDPAGVTAFSTLQMAFDPLAEEICVNSVRVKQGTNEIASGAPANIYVTDDQSTEIVSHRKTLNIAVPGLRPGVVLEFTVTRLTSGGADASPFLEYDFARPFPVRRSVVFLAGNGRGLMARTSPVTQARPLGGGTYWEQEDPPLAREEPLQPPAADFLPKLWLGRDLPQWGTLVLRYLTQISDRMALNEDLRILARRLTEAETNDAARVAVLARYVQTNLTYKALEFGRRGRVPELPEQVARNRFGDCKDHAVMLQQLLSVVGVKSSLALVNSSGGVVKELPSLEQFDHMILYVPGQGTNGFIDCTHKGAWPGEGPPPELDEHEALVLDDTAPRFERVPALTKPSAIHSERTVTITNRQDALVQETLTLTGLEGAHTRAMLLEMATASQRLYLQRHLGTADAELLVWRVDGLSAPDRPLEFHLTYLVRQAFHELDGRLAGSIPALAERYYLTYEAVEKRRTPFAIRHPLAFTSRMIMKAPSGFTAEAKTEPETRTESDFLVVRSARGQGEGEVKLEFECRQKAGHFGAERYGAFRDESTRACGFLERQVVFVPSSAR